MTPLTADERTRLAELQGDRMLSLLEAFERDQLETRERHVIWLSANRIQHADAYLDVSERTICLTSTPHGWSYEIEIERVAHPSDVAEWTTHIIEKVWSSARVVGGFAMCLRDTCDLFQVEPRQLFKDGPRIKWPATPTFDLEAIAQGADPVVLRRVGPWVRRKQMVEQAGGEFTPDLNRVVVLLDELDL